MKEGFGCIGVVIKFFVVPAAILGVVVLLVVFGLEQAGQALDPAFGFMRALGFWLQAIALGIVALGSLIFLARNRTALLTVPMMLVPLGFGGWHVLNLAGAARLGVGTSVGDWVATVFWILVMLAIDYVSVSLRPNAKEQRNY